MTVCVKKINSTDTVTHVNYCHNLHNKYTQQSNSVRNICKLHACQFVHTPKPPFFKMPSDKNSVLYLNGPSSL